MWLGATKMRLGCYSGATWVLHGCDKVLLGCVKVLLGPWVLLGCDYVLLGCYMVVTRCYLGATRCYFSATWELLECELNRCVYIGINTVHEGHFWLILV